MNREIKFRMWDKSLNKMIYRHLEKYDNEHPDIVVMQYTGLPDKQGKEIYEGDILNANNGTKLIVVWRADLASFALSSKDWAYDHYFGEAVDSGHCEIIGNIHENKNLLK